MIPGEVVRAISRHIESLTARNRSRISKRNARPDAFKPKVRKPPLPFQKAAEN